MKKAITALSIGLLIGSASTALAANTEAVQAVFAQFNLKINGEDKQFETPPLVYDGTSYLPVREIATLVGYDVTYDEESRTIVLNQTEPSTQGAESMKTNVVSTEINGRELVELLGEKYPDLTKDPMRKQISLSPDGTLKIDETTYKLNIDDNGNVDAKPLIDEDVLTIGDLQ